MFNSHPTYEPARKPTRMRILRRPAKGWIFYQSPRDLGTNKKGQVEELMEHFHNWLRINKCNISQVRRARLYCSNKTKVEQARKFCRNFFNENQTSQEYIQSDGLPKGAEVELFAVVQKKDY